MKILLVGGFLGSGKTSFILQLAHYMVEEMNIPNIAILENEIGEVSIDNQVLGGAGFEVRTLFSGCVCCSMAGELPIAIEKIQKEIDPEWLIMEATGLAFPSSIQANLELAFGIRARICCLADAKRWDRILRAMEQLVNDQVKGADIILVNKVDLVDEETVEKVIDSVKRINPDANAAAMSAGEKIPEGIFEKVLTEA